jgi:acid phosphatase class B
MQAESWHNEFGNLLVQSGISTAPLTTDCSNHLVTLEEINDAMESAASNVSLDLDEALALKDLGEWIQQWQD